MRITRITKRWYRAGQRIENGILSYEVKAYSTTPYKALVKIIRQEFIRLEHGN